MNEVEVESFDQGYTYSQARRHERLPVDFSVSLRWPSLRLADRAFDLSEGGLGVKTAEPLEPMTLVSMHLDLPRSAGVDLLGRVMWSRADSMGLRFESSDPRLFDSLQRLRADFARL